MTRRILVISSLGFLCPWILGSVFAQQTTTPPEPPEDLVFTAKFKSAARSGEEPKPLAYRQEWKSGWDMYPDGTVEFKGVSHYPQEPLSQDHVKNPNLELRMYGAYQPKDPSIFEDVPPWNRPALLFSHQFKEQVPHSWNGMCSPNCAATFRERDHYVDLSGNASVRWITKVLGTGHDIRLILKLADGTWMMSDNWTTGYSSDYVVSEVAVRDIIWKHLNVDYKIPAHVPEQHVYSSSVGEHADGRWFLNPDLSKVDEIGWTDLTPGLGHGQGGMVAVGWMEVYGTLVKRTSSNN